MNTMVTDKTDELMAELKQWCSAEHGRRAEVARIVGVHPTRITQWIARTGNPGAEAALRIREFLESPEKFRKPGRGLVK
jgi:DNA-binding transcriptional regulator YdaS (Cro superfamily)